MKVSSTVYTRSLFLVVLIALFLATTTITVHADENQQEVTEDFQCTGICGNNPDGTNLLANPDSTVTYNWAPRVPVGSSEIGVTEETLTCADFDSRLYSFSNDVNECTKHQAGLNAVGCVCSDGTSGAAARMSNISSMMMVVVVVASSWMMLNMLA